MKKKYSERLFPSPAIHNRGWQNDAYGNTETGDNAAAIENHHAYTGAHMDDETGLYYLSSRYYDPKTGSFTSVDSYRGEGEGYWQLYAYCEGDPVNYSDLSGHEPVTLAVGAISVKAAIAVIAGVLVTYLAVDGLTRKEKSIIAQLEKKISDGIKSFISSLSLTLTKAKQHIKNSKMEKHHIVAKNDFRAGTGRFYLKKVNISTESSYNLVKLKYWLHRHLHTKKYHTSVGAIVKAAYTIGAKIKSSRIFVIGALTGIKVALKAASGVL